MNFDRPCVAKTQTLTELQRSRLSPEEFNDLRNDEVIQRILIEGATDEQERLRSFHKITPENFSLLKHFSRLRHRAVTACEAAGAIRQATNPEFTDLEKRLDQDSNYKDAGNRGIYLEYIEPQVRQAVVNLSNKGYSTFESGFYGDNRQRISFNGDQLEKYKPTTDLIAWLEQNGFNLIVSPSMINLVCTKKLSLDDLKTAWDKVIADIPSRE